MRHFFPFLSHFTDGHYLQIISFCCTFVICLLLNPRRNMDGSDPATELKVEGPLWPIHSDLTVERPLEPGTGRASSVYQGQVWGGVWGCHLWSPGEAAHGTETFPHIPMFLMVLGWQQKEAPNPTMWVSKSLWSLPPEPIQENAGEKDSRKLCI